MRVMREETFGPVVGLMKVRDDEEAIALMNDSDLGLTASVWTRDLEAAERAGAADRGGHRVRQSLRLSRSGPGLDRLQAERARRLARPLGVRERDAAAFLPFEARLMSLPPRQLELSHRDPLRRRPHRRACRGVPRARRRAAAAGHRSGPRRAADGARGAGAQRRGRAADRPCSPRSGPIPSAPTSSAASPLRRRRPRRRHRLRRRQRARRRQGHRLHVGQSRPLWDFEDKADWWTRADEAGIAPVIAVPTTAGTGSEVGRAGVILDEAEAVKKIIFHPKMMPRIVIADPELSVGLPPGRHRRHRHGRPVALPRSLLCPRLPPDGRRHRRRRAAADPSLAEARL